MSPIRVKRLSQAAAMALATVVVASACASDPAGSGEVAVRRAEPQTTSNEAEEAGDGDAPEGLPATEGETSEPATDGGAGDQPETSTDSDSGGNDSDPGDNDSDSGDSDSGDSDSGDSDSGDSDSGDSDGGAGFPGSPLDFGPVAGTPLSVVGVRYDDHLNLRADPNPSAALVARAAPLDDSSIVAVGEAWQSPSGVWWKVTVDGNEGWANQSFLGSPIDGVELFDEVVEELEQREFDTLTEAALATAATRASSEPRSRVVQASEPLLFEDGGRAIVDVLDLGDDSVKGERLAVTVETVYGQSGTEGAQDVLGVRITSVRIMAICGRGVSGGLCR